MTKQYSVTIQTIYEHTITVDIDMDAYNEWATPNTDDSIEAYIESEIDYGNSVHIPVPLAIENDFHSYEIQSVEELEEITNG